MLYYIKRTLMIKSAQDSLPPDKKAKPISLELLIFLLVATIATIPQSIISTVIVTVFLITSPTFQQLVLDPSATYESILSASIEITEQIPTWAYSLLLFGSGAMIIAAILYCKLFEKRKPFTLGFNKRGFITEYLLGALIGFIMISLPVLACHLSGSVTLQLSENIDPAAIILFFVAFLFQGMGEEALFRGYLMTSIARRHKIWVAIIINSVVFSLFHIGNANFSIIAFINITLFGIFASVFMLKRGSIWAVGAIHSVWNFAQGSLFGFNVSGNPKFDTVMEAIPGKVGAILSGGDFGPEGGLGVTVILLIAILLSLLMPTKKSEIAEENESELQNGKNL